MEEVKEVKEVNKVEEKSAAAPPPAAPKPPPRPPPKMADTMSALQALIGDTPAEAAAAATAAADDAAWATAAKEKAAKAAEKSVDVSVSIAPAALEALQEAEKARKDGKAPEGTKAFGGEDRDKNGDKIGGKDGDTSKDGWLTSVVDGLADASKNDREARTPEENAKLDKVLADLTDLAGKGKDARTSDEVKVGPARWRPPRHRNAFEPSFLESIGILRRVEQYLPGPRSRRSSTRCLRFWKSAMSRRCRRRMWSASRRR